MTPENISDSSRPNAGRIYDYLLGGSHNFEIDRQAAERVRNLIPSAAKTARLQRWCLRDIATELAVQRGYKVIIDFASGLPTNDHIHLVVPPDTTVIYSDYDAVTVEYAKEILKDVSNVHYFLADTRCPEALLAHSEVEKVLQGRRDVAFVSWGVSAFLKDEEISHIARVLYEWAGKNSCWAFDAQGAGQGTHADDPVAAKVRKIYEQMGTPVYNRSLDKLYELLNPWKPDQGGFVSLLEWHGFDRSEVGMTDEDLRTVGESGGGHGVYLVK